MTTTGLEFQAIGAAEFPPGRIAQIYKELGENSGHTALRLVISFLRQETMMHFRALPEALKGIDFGSSKTTSSLRI